MIGPHQLLRKRPKYIRDARRRKVTQLDPIVLYLTKRSEPIEREVLGRIVAEKGVRMTGFERAAMIGSLVLLVALICVIIMKLMQGMPPATLARRMSVPSYSFVLPFIVWGGMKRSRFGKTAAAMLRHLRCPHCGYDLRNLPVDGNDNATLCPECGCAWTLNIEPPEDEAGANNVPS